MKKIYLLFISVSFSVSAFSQALPNPGFENWTHVSAGNYDNPDNWNTLNSATWTFGAITAQKATSADAHSGSYAVKLKTLYVIIQNANGIVTTGSINVGNQTVDGGIPYTLRPDSITGWYKCDPQGGDNGFVDFGLYDAAGTDTIGFAHFQTPTVAVTTYTYFSVPIVYRNANTPALSRCLVSSSAGYTSVLNSVMFVDDLELVLLPDGIRESVFGSNTVRYNESKSLLNVNSRQTASLAVIDMTGKQVFNSDVNPGTSEFRLSKLVRGLYVYMLTDENGKKVSSGKFIVQ